MGFHDKKKKLVNSVWQDYFRVLIREKHFCSCDYIYVRTYVGDLCLFIKMFSPPLVKETEK